MLCETIAFGTKRIRLMFYEAGEVCFIHDQLEALGSFVFFCFIVFLSYFQAQASG